MRKFLSFVLAAVMMLSLAATAFAADGVSEDNGYPEGMSEAAIVFVENFWVFNADCKDGVFKNDTERFLRSVGEIRELRDAVGEVDYGYDEVVEALQAFYEYETRARFLTKLGLVLRPMRVCIREFRLI